MNELTLPEVSDLDKSIFVARHINYAMDVLRPLVYAVWKDDLWRGRFSSFSEYVISPQGLGKSQGYGSKLRKVEEFRIESGMDVSGIDYEAMYLSINAGGTPEQIVQRAKDKNREQIRADRNETTNHEHTWITACSECWEKKQDA